MAVCAINAIVTLAALRSPLGKQRRVANSHGNIFVDESCIDCDTCRWMAPEVYGRAGSKSFVHKQPEASQQAAALAAAVACPTGSIRTETPDPGMKAVLSSFPLPIDAARLPHVFHLGYHCPASFGATPYLLTAAPHGNVMIDCPRYNSRLAKQLDALGGVDVLLLTHMDDVGDMARWKERYPQLQRYMHAADVGGPKEWPYIDMRGVEHQLSDDARSSSSVGESSGRWRVLPGLSAIWTPGHSRGSLSFLAEASLTGGIEGALFTGDHFCFSGRLGRLDGMARYGWDLPLQSESIRKLANEPYLWVLPGHGRRHRFASANERVEKVLAAAESFAADPLGTSAPGPVYVTPETTSSSSSSRSSGQVSMMCAGVSEAQHLVRRSALAEQPGWASGVGVMLRDLEHLIDEWTEARMTSLMKRSTSWRRRAGWSGRRTLAARAMCSTARRS